MKKSEKKGEFKESVNSPLNNNKREFFYLGPKNNWQNLLDDKMLSKMNQYFGNDLKLLRYETWKLLVLKIFIDNLKVILNEKENYFSSYRMLGKNGAANN